MTRQRLLQVLIAIGCLIVAGPMVAEDIEADVEIKSVHVEDMFIAVLLNSEELEIDISRHTEINVGTETSIESLQVGQKVTVLYENRRRSKDAIRITLSEEKPAEPVDSDPLAKANQLRATALRLMENGEYFDAEAPLKEAIQIIKQELGDAHPDFRKTMDDLASLYLTVAKGYENVDLKIADYAWRELKELRVPYDKDHWQLTDARLGLQRIQFMKNLSEDQRQRLDDVKSLRQKMLQLFGEKKFSEAKDAAEEVVNIQRKVWGEKHKEVADSLVHFADLLEYVDEREKALLNREQALNLYRKALGTQHPVYLAHRKNVLGNFELLGRYENAKPLYQEELAINTERYGSEDWRTKDAELGVQRVDALLGFDEQERSDLVEATNLIQAAYKKSDLLSAIKDAEQAREIRVRILGENQVDTAACLNLLGVLHFKSGKLEKAKQFYLDAKTIRKEFLGEAHPSYATCLNNLGDVYRAFGEYDQAKTLYDEALIIDRQLASDHPENLATNLNNLALLLQEMGEYEKAKPRYDEALQILDENQQHWPSATAFAAEYAQSLNNLAGLLQGMGDIASARPLYRRAKDIRGQYLGEETLEYANSLNNLATLYHEQARLGLEYDANRYDTAEKYFRKALEILKKQNSDHPDYATTLTNLAILCDDRGKFDDRATRRQEYLAEAGRLHHESLEVWLKNHDESHPDVAASVGALAGYYRSVGRFEEAEVKYSEALKVFEEGKLGDVHPVHATLLRNRAKLYESEGDLENAVPDLKRALKIDREKLDLTAAVQSERQQLAMATLFRGTLDRWLSLSTRTEVPAEETYEHVLQWKGAVFSRQLQQRKYRRAVAESDDPKVQILVKDLESVACRIASLALTVPVPGQEQSQWQRLGELTGQKEKLEAELADRSTQFRREQAAAQITVEQLKELLPVGVVLVDLLQYTHSSPTADGTGQWNKERRLMAYVVRNHGPIVPVELGLMGPITEAVNLWLKDTKRNNPILDKNGTGYLMVNLKFKEDQWFLIPQKFGGDDSDKPTVPISQQVVERILDREPTAADRQTRLRIDPAAALQRLLWKPLAAHLEPDEYVLVSPDGAIARMPLAALPGSEPNTYLIEERAIATIAVPQMLSEILTKADKTQQATPTMLLVGDVEYGANVEENATPGEQRQGVFGSWIPLLGSRTEILALEDSFRREFDTIPQTLRERDATEQRIREEAPKHSWLHFATHGFFADPEQHSAFGAADDNTRSAGMTREGEALATAGIGEFHPGVLSGVVLAGANQPTGDGSNDGMLTAMEVAEMDLQNVEVVVLSACETSLGEVAGGEGVLGIQRAFQMAGAKTVVASYWKVDDLATQQLMSNFYQQLWHAKEKRLSKLEAFREAQLMILRDGIQRGRRLREKPTSRFDPRTPPYEWASFSISGDWR